MINHIGLHRSMTLIREINKYKEEKNEPFVHVYVGLLADDVGETSPNTLDGGESEHDLLLSIDVGVQHTQNMLELLICDERLQQKKIKVRFKIKG